MRRASAIRVLGAIFFFLTAISCAQTSSPLRKRVCLSQILIATSESAPPAQIAAAKHKAEQLRDAIQSGGSFADLARTNSEGPTASQGGMIGCFDRGQLAKPIEEIVFPMNIGSVSDVLRTKLGFLLLQVVADEPQFTSESPQQPVLVLSGHESGVRGRVVTSDHGPIANAYVLAHSPAGNDIHMRTDSGGRYAMPLLIGIYDVFISAEWYSPTSRKIEVKPDGMMIFDAVLEFNTLGMQIN